jgi:protein-L-isoaspartate(D-aspartate) O-methyltransferase
MTWRDYADARNRMVDGQIRPNKVTDRRILDAMRDLPRERFMPTAALVGGGAALAYADEDVPLGGGRYLIEPMVLARLLQLARPRRGERALVIGAGTGYGAAVLARCGAAVIALEEDPRLTEVAEPMLAETAPAVQLVRGPLREGWSSTAPYDLVVIEGAVRAFPAAIEQQVKTEGGRLVGILAREGRGGGGVLAEPSQGHLRAQIVFDCATPLLTPLLTPPGFMF